MDDATPSMIGVMDERSLRPLHDMGTMPWVRSIVYRTTWSSSTKTLVVFDVTISAYQETEHFTWRAEGDIAGERVTVTDVMYANPIEALHAAQQVILARLHGV